MKTTGSPRTHGSSEAAALGDGEPLSDAEVIARLVWPPPVGDRDLNPENVPLLHGRPALAISEEPLL